MSASRSHSAILLITHIYTAGQSLSFFSLSSQHGRSYCSGQRFIYKGKHPSPGDNHDATAESIRHMGEYCALHPLCHLHVRTLIHAVFWSLTDSLRISRLEMTARIAVSGLVLDPGTPCSALFLRPFTARPFKWEKTVQLLGDAWGLDKSHAAPQPKGLRPLHLVSSDDRRLSLDSTRTAPHKQSPSIELGNTPPSGSQHVRRTSIPIPEELPFTTAFAHSRSLAHRGVPYLRHSWSRVDALAIVCFWAAFSLSAVGFERRSNLHWGFLEL